MCKLGDILRVKFSIGKFKYMENRENSKFIKIFWWKGNVYLWNEIFLLFLLKGQCSFVGLQCLLLM